MPSQILVCQNGHFLLGTSYVAKSVVLGAKRGDKLGLVHISKRTLGPQPTEVTGWLDKTLNGKDLVAYKEDCKQGGPTREGPSWAHDTNIRNADG